MTPKQRNKAFMASPIAKCEISDDDKIYVFSPNKRLNKIRTCNQGLADFKPQGLWYSYGAEWIRFLHHEYIEYSEDWAYERINYYKTLFEINLNFKSKLLKLKTKNDAINFTKTYGVVVPSRHRYIYNHLINWNKVAKEYDGIDSVFKGWSYDFYWLATWDINGGCLFNNKCVESVKTVFKV